MLSRGSNGRFTPRRRAVAGMSCISPRAPFRETAHDTKFDSTRMTAARRAGSMRCFLAASRIWEEKGDEGKRPEEEEEGARLSEKTRTDRGAARSASLAGLSEVLSGADAGRSYSSSTMRSTMSSGIVIQLLTD